jgi:hypothetical protein
MKRNLTFADDKLVPMIILGYGDTKLSLVSIDSGEETDIPSLLLIQDEAGEIGRIMPAFDEEEDGKNALCAIGFKAPKSVDIIISRLQQLKGKTWNATKTLEIESQTIDTENEKHMLHKLLLVAEEAGYTHVNDNWGVNAADNYTIGEAIKKFQY